MLILSKHFISICALCFSDGIMLSVTTFRVIPWLTFPVFLAHYNSNHRAKTSPESSCYSLDENTGIRVLLLILYLLIRSLLQTFYCSLKAGLYFNYYLVTMSTSSIEQNVRSARHYSNSSVFTPLSSITLLSTTLILSLEI